MESQKKYDAMSVEHHLLRTKIDMRTVHQGKRELTKREVTDKQAILACTDIRTCEDSVEPVPQAETNTDKARKQGHLACTDIRTCEVPAGLYSETCEAQVESNPPRCGLAHLWEPGLEMQACQDCP